MTRTSAVLLSLAVAAALTAVVAVCSPSASEPVVITPITPPNDGLTTRERILSNYTGEARRLKERALDTNDPKDVLAFVNRVKQHPEEKISNAAPSSPARGSSTSASQTSPEVLPR